MIRCPTCQGVGRTMSTRNESNSIIRWHKCEDCGLSFTSTQKVDLKYCENLKSQYIESIIDSKEFRAAIKPLFDAFSLIDGPWTYWSDPDEITSIGFVDTVKPYDSKFIISLSVNIPNIYGVISLANIKYNGELASKTLVGQIRFDGNNWLLDLDLTTINRINKI